MAMEKEKLIPLFATFVNGYIAANIFVYENKTLHPAALRPIISANSLCPRSNR